MLLAMKSTDRGIRCRKDGVLFVLSNKNTVEVPTDGQTAIEYMITCGMPSHPAGFYVEPVTDAYELVSHNGFECSGSMCRTLAYAGASHGYITPGRVQQLVHVAENANAGKTWNIPFTPLQPGQVYIKRGETRAAGLPDISPDILARQAERANYVKACNERVSRYTESVADRNVGFVARGFAP
jgi:hypothetical protein